jgi:hypothetical protein
MFTRPSSQSRCDSPVIKGGNLIETWKKSIPDERVTRAMEIVNYFGLDRIYSADTRPNVEEAERFLESNLD